MNYTNEHNGHAGDTQYFSIDNLPKNAKKVKKQPIAFGESHNHAHIITGDYELFQDEKNIFYIKTGPGKTLAQHTFESMITNETYDSQELVTVADHLPCELLPKKIYRVGIHRKYEPYKKIWEQVRD